MINSRRQPSTDSSNGLYICARRARDRTTECRQANTRRTILTTMLLWAWMVTAAFAGEGTLVWSNGDSLSGTLVGSDGKSLTWQSTLFADPLQIDLSSLTAVIYPKSEPAKASDSEFSILMGNGDLLRGDLKAIDENMLTFEGARFGTIQIPRSEIISIQRSAGHALIYLGPRGLDGWQHVPRPSTRRERPGIPPALVRDPFGGNEPSFGKANVPSWSEGPDGTLHSSKPDRDLFLSQHLPEKFEIEVQLQSKKTCSFAMVIGSDSKSGLRVETWVDVLVAVNNIQFKPLRELTSEDHELHLHVFVDFSAESMSVYSSSGEKLGEVDTKGLRHDADGLTFRCLENDLTIRRLRIRQWDGSAPRIVNGDQTRVHLNDGKIHYGAIRQFKADSGSVVLHEENAEVDLPVGTIDSIYMNNREGSPKIEPDASRITWHDGGCITGSLVSIADGAAKVATSYIKEPLHCNLDELTRITLPGKTRHESAPVDRLFHSRGSLQGNLVVDGDSETPIRWKPLGGLNASAVKYSGDARFVRGGNVTHFSQQPDLLAGYPDVIYLGNNDVLPCRFEGCSDDTIQFTSPFATARSLPRGEVRAVELAATNRIHQSGFGAEGWKGVTDKQKLVFNGNSRFSHPSILTGDTIRFRLNWPAQAFLSLTVSLYGTGEHNDTGSTFVTLSILQNVIQVLDRPPPPQNPFMIRGFVRKNQEGTVFVKESAADIQIVARDGNLLVSVNGNQVKTIKVNPAAAESRALAFSGSSVSTNRHVVINGRVQMEPIDGAEISQFEIDNRSGISIRNFIEEESRRAALTVPRFRRDHPPTHVLLAPNGDLLRGRLLAVNDQQITFESRLETLRLDRKRVAAIVWLRAEKKELPDPAAGGTSNESEKVVTDAEGDKTTVLAELADGFSINLAPTRLDQGQLQGDSALLGKCSFPAATIRELIVGDISSHSIVAYDGWIAQHAKEPDWDIPQSDGGNSAAAAMIGQVADDFQLPMLDGTTFRLKDHTDKIIVLDFWATWCGPCVAALPDYIRATSVFDRSKVVFVAVNVQESSDQIRAFLGERNLSVSVALDRSAEVSSKFKVNGIPHTVILGPGNVVESVHVGYQPGTGDVLQTTIRQMLDGTWKRPLQADKLPDLK